MVGQITLGRFQFTLQLYHELMNLTGRPAFNFRLEKKCEFFVYGNQARVRRMEVGQGYMQHIAGLKKTVE